MQRFKALVASKGAAGQSLDWQELTEGDLMEGDVPSQIETAPDGEVRGAVVRRSIAPWLFLAAGLLALLEAVLRSRGPLRAKLA